MHCEGACGHWFHVWCMGYVGETILSLQLLTLPMISYHSNNDERLPKHFICFDCVARSEDTWELIKNTMYPQMRGRLEDLARFR